MNILSTQITILHSNYVLLKFRFYFTQMMMVVIMTMSASCTNDDDRIVVCCLFVLQVDLIHPVFLSKDHFQLYNYKN